MMENRHKMPNEGGFESVESMYTEVNGQKYKENSWFCPFYGVSPSR